MIKQNLVSFFHGPEIIPGSIISHTFPKGLFVLNNLVPTVLKWFGLYKPVLHLCRFIELKSYGNLDHHPQANTSAICIVFKGNCFSRIYPSRCMRQDRSVEIIVDAPVCKALFTFWSAIPMEMGSYFIAK